ncbi:hypothetical protein P3342_004390 [Pyrenophora teres f. teres]|nr:hypothetical protein P3342_004390 [Pyrenophora teres f. teres]
MFTIGRQPHITAAKPVLLVSQSQRLDLALDFLGPGRLRSLPIADGGDPACEESLSTSCPRRALDIAPSHARSAASPCTPRALTAAAHKSRTKPNSTCRVSRLSAPASASASAPAPAPSHSASLPYCPPPALHSKSRAGIRAEPRR